jgi:hypothetical protein
MYCKGCGKEHKDSSWKYAKGGWYCTLFHFPTNYEFIPENVREERVEYFNSTIQPFRGGELSKEYVEAHGTEGIDVTDKEVKKAKEVWKDLKGHKTRKKSK